MRWWPRSIRWQMLAGLLLLEMLSLGLFAVLLVHQQTEEVHTRAQQRLAYEVSSLALQSREALLQQRPGWVGLSVKMMGEAPTVLAAKVTDPAGNVLFVSRGEADQTVLDPIERTQIRLVRRDEPRFFTLEGNRWESMKAIYTGSDLRGFAWVEFDQYWAREQLKSILRSTAIFGIIWIAASALLVLLMARSISRPLATLHRGTRALMNAPESGGKFPLPVAMHNEIGDLIEAFNRMVASIAEQRAGLNDTLSLLDSMLANAPIGLAFFDRSCRFVRVNQVFADMTGFPLSRHLGRTLLELFPEPVATDLENTVLRDFAEEEAVRNLEISGLSGKPGQRWTWLVSAYPVRTTPQQVRWAGVIVLDATDRKRSEEALRRTEKLAATGRLAASIAHEINNPLEAITNLLFLLRNFCQLEDPALNYVAMAEHEAHRISEITQQTLRFYRQSTLPTRAKMSELLDSVLSLYHGRLHGLGIEVERDYDPEMDLFCFAGEMRQVFANLIGNAIDALGADGHLLVRARRSRNWSDSKQTGVRFTVADTGAGMEPEVRERAFEAFFTTKEVTGTGLGLWVSQEILVKHHSVMHVRSRSTAQYASSQKKATGTVFQIFIPDDPTLTAPPRPAVAAVVAKPLE
ncbi:MAG: ATP-binding protein [Terracidiphilus sp.]|nr:ATP-binding protein [Terracidiphilus sp.]